MKKKGMKTLTTVLACSMVLGTVPPVEGVSGLPALTMSAEAAAPKKLTIKASGTTVYAGKSVKLDAKVTKGAKVTYKSSDKSVAAINAKGILTGRKAGTARITITAKKAKYKTVKKTLKVKVVRQKQKIAVSNQTITIGKKIKLGAKGKTALSYSTSNKSIATISQKGIITAKKAGKVKITVSAKKSDVYDKATKTITVTVKPKQTKAPKQTETQKQTEKPKQTEAPKQTEKPKQTEAPKQTEKPKQTEAPKQTEKPKQTEAQKQTEKPKQTETQKQTEKPKQTETQKQTEKPKQTETQKQTEKPKPSVSYVTNVYFAESYKSNILYVGESKNSTLKWTATGNTTLKDFVFKSSDPSIATVDENGTITAVGAGTVRITATSKTPFSPLGSAPDDYFSATQKYQIKTRTSPIDSIAYPVITGGEAVTEKNILIGETKGCTLDIRSMSNGSVDDLDFTSSDPSVATVDKKGNVKGISKGYVTITAKTKLPSDMDGTTILTTSTTYHVGEYTYGEILNGLTMDTAAGKSAHNIMNDLRKNPSHRNFFKNYPSYPEREWDNTLLRSAATRASRNIVCYVLGGWNEGEKSSRNPLASHKGNLNGYGGAGWKDTGAELGKAASVFFEDAGHFGNETDSHYKYEAVAVVQYKNPSGVNLTSMIVQAGTYYAKTIMSEEIRISCMPESQFMDFCNHFGIPTTDPKVSVDTQSVDEEMPAVVESETEILEDAIMQEDMEATDGSVVEGEIPENAIIQEEDTEVTSEFVIEDEIPEDTIIQEEGVEEIPQEAIEDSVMEDEEEVLEEEELEPEFAETEENILE